LVVYFSNALPYVLSLIHFKTAQDLRGCFLPDKADNAGGLSPVKAENKVKQKTDRKDETVLKWTNYIFYHMVFCAKSQVAVARKQKKDEPFGPPLVTLLTSIIPFYANRRLIYRKRLIPLAFKHLSLTEQQRHAPHTGQRNQGIYDPADSGVGTAENPGDHVKFKNTDAAPVQSTKDCQKQRYPVKHGFQLLLSC